MCAFFFFFKEAKTFSEGAFKEAKNLSEGASGGSGSAGWLPAPQ